MMQHDIMQIIQYILIEFDVHNLIKFNTVWYDLIYLDKIWLRKPAGRVGEVPPCERSEWVTGVGT